MASIIKVDQIQESTTGVGTNFSTTGSATTPTISIGNQTNKGLYHLGTDKLGIAIGGQKVGEIASNGITINIPYVCFIDEKSNNTHAGTFTSGAWRTRDLNTIRGENTIISSSLISNQFTLPSGTYRISSHAPGYYVGFHKAKLRNITDSSDTIIGTSEFTPQGTTGDDCTKSFINGIFTIISQKTFEIQHYAFNTMSQMGFGRASNFGVVEIYTIVELWKLT